MRGERFFEIRNNRDLRANLVEAIPSNWEWVDGSLVAPSEFIAWGQVSEDTGFVLGNFLGFKPTIVGSYDRGTTRRSKPDLFAIMVEQKLPGFVSFDEAGKDASIITFELSKRLAIGFLKKGYRGSLRFYKGHHHDNKYHNPAQCNMRFES